MSIKITKKELQNTYTKIYRCGYCDAKIFYPSISATYYNCGVHGWNYYGFIVRDANGGEALITSGFRGTFGAELPEEAKKAIKQANKAQKDYTNGKIDCATKTRKIKRLKAKFDKILIEA